MVFAFIVLGRVQPKTKSGERMRKHKMDGPISPSDKHYFLEFYQAHKQLMYYLANRYTMNSEDADDLVQDALLRLIHHIPTLKRLEKEKSARYVALTVKSTFLDYERARHKELMINMDESDFERIIEMQLPELDVEQKASVRLAVVQLKTEIPLRDWLILEGKYITGLSDEEIGALVGVTAASVRVLLYRAREKARAILGEDSVIGIGGD